MTKSNTPQSISYLKLVVKDLRAGMEKGVHAEVAKGVPQEEAQARLRRNAEAFGAYLASPDFNIASVAKPVETKSEREALFEEIKALCGACVVSKWPGSPRDHNVLETHSGKGADLNILQLMSKASLTINEKIGLFPRLESEAREHIGKFHMKSTGELTYFGFHCLSAGRDGIGRQYHHQVYLFLPSETAEKLFNFIMREDPNFVLDLYKDFFPKNSEKNPITFSPKLTFVKDGQSFAVPTFEPRL